MSTREFTVTGMTCGHCVQSVTEEVSEVPGVVDVRVVLETGALTVTGEAEPAAVVAAVAEAGYQAAEVTS
ncbi:MAG: heavy-metal-associated domain-containing protein [Marmoricola sp.]